MTGPAHRRGRPKRLLRGWVVLLALVSACTTEPVLTPTPGPIATPESTPPGKVVGDLALEACDPEGAIACEQQAVVLAEEIAGTSLSLTYSSEWADGRLDRPTWNADWLGLGGWALDAHQRYDVDNHVLLSGDGTWRIVQAFDLPSGEQAVPAFDAREYYVFDAARRHVRTIDGMTGATLIEFTYDDAGRLAGAAGHHEGTPINLSIERAADGRSATLLGIGGVATRLSIGGPLGALTLVHRPDRTALSLDPRSQGLLGGWHEGGGGRTAFTYDPATGRLTTATDPDGVVVQLALSRVDGGISIAVTSAADEVTTFRSERDGTALRRVVVAPDGTTTSLLTQPDGATELAMPDGTKVTTGSVPDPRWGPAAPVRSPYVELRPDGVTHRIETSVTVASGNDQLAGVDLQIESLIDGARWIDSYDPPTRTHTRRDPEGRETVRVGDATGRLIELRAPGQPRVKFGYDALSRLTSTATTTSAGVATTRYAYDPTSGEVVHTRPDGSVARFLYDARGRLVRASGADGAIASLILDAAGRPLQVGNGDHLPTTLGYSAAGRPTGYLPPVVGTDGSYEISSYDDAGRLETIAGPGARHLSFVYDQAGRTSTVQIDAGEFRLEYDSATGQLTRSVAPGGVVTTLGYSGALISSLAWSGGGSTGRVDLTLDASQRLIAQAVNGTPDLEFAYDDSGALTAIGDVVITRDPTSGRAVRTVLGATQIDREYSVDGRLARSVTSVKGKVVLTLRYTRDRMGRVTRIEQDDPEGDPSVTAYGYDAAGRLLTVTVDGVTVQRNVYGSTGDRSSVTTPAGKTLGSYDDRDRLLGWGKVTYAYEPGGTLSSRQGPDGETTYDFDDFGTLRGVTQPDGRRITYLIDADGRRIGRQIDGSLTAGYLYRPDGLVVAEVDARGDVVSQFGYDDLGHLALVVREGRSFLVTTDHLGSPILVVDSASGEVIQAIEYDAWGRVTRDTNPGFVPIGFAGGLFDQASGMVHFGARDYDPTTGRWTGPDPIRFDGGDANLYRYVGADPVNSTDLLGLECFSIYGFCDLEDPGDRSPPPRPHYDHADPFEYVPGVWPEGRCKGPGGRCRGETEDPGPLPPLPPGSCAGPGGKCPGEVEGPGPQPAAPPGASSGWCLIYCQTPDGRVCIGPCSWGDPHMRTGDGLPFDFQAAGEFTMLRSVDGTFVLQARQEPPGSRTDLTVVTAVATLVNGDRVAFYTDPARPLVVNGDVIDRADVAIRLPGGGSVERHGKWATVRWPDGSQIVVQWYKIFLNFGFASSEPVEPTLVGVLGNLNGDVSDDLTTRGGVILDPDDPGFFESLHGEFADSWRIKQAESLFDYLPGETTATFTNLDIPSAQTTVETLDPAARASAEALCTSLGVSTEPTKSACVLDVAATGDASFAAAAVVVEASTATRGQAPLGTTAPIELDSDVAGEITGPSEVDGFHFDAAAGDSVYFEPLGNVDANIGYRIVEAGSPDIQVTSGSMNDGGGRAVLEQGGRYLVLLVGPGIGRYAFRLHTVPPDEEFRINLGDEIGADRPAAGAGRIPSPGALDRFVLDVPAGQGLYLETVGQCSAPLRWRILDPTGATVDSARCRDIALPQLEPGRYTITVSGDLTETGTYQFRTWAVPPPTTFNLQMGDQVGPGKPAAGSGRIETPGSSDVYVFDMTSGQRLLVDVPDGTCLTKHLYEITGPDDGSVATGRLCDQLESPPLVAAAAGAYRMRVYGDGATTGDYAFSLATAP